MTLLNQWKNKHSFGSLTYDICVQDDKLSNTAMVLRACRVPHATAFMATLSPCGKEKGEKALRGAGSLGTSKDQVTGTLEIAAKEVGGGGLIQIAANSIRNHTEARVHICKGRHAAVCRASLLERG